MRHASASAVMALRMVWSETSEAVAMRAIGAGTIRSALLAVGVPAVLPAKCGTGLAATYTHIIIILCRAERMDMKAKLATILVLGIAAAVAAISLRYSSDDPGLSVLSTSLPPATDGPAKPAKAPSVAANSTEGSHRGTNAQFLSQSSMWDYYQAHLSAAEAGDAEAQLAVWKAGDYCRTKLRFYFTKAGRQLSFEEGVQYSMNRGYDYALFEHMYEQCREFSAHPEALDEANEIRRLNAAASAGQPVAQALLATKIFRDDLVKQNEKSSGINLGSGALKLDRSKSALELIKDAVKGGGDAEVFFVVFELLPVVAPKAGQDDVERFAWLQLACERGYGCDSQAEWVQVSCYVAECKSLTAKDEIVRVLAGDAYPIVQQRARELESAMAAGHWDDLGLTASAGG